MEREMGLEVKEEIRESSKVVETEHNGNTEDGGYEMNATLYGTYTK